MGGARMKANTRDATSTSPQIMNVPRLTTGEDEPLKRICSWIGSLIRSFFPCKHIQSTRSWKRKRRSDLLRLRGCCHLAGARLALTARYRVCPGASQVGFTETALML